MSGRLNRVQRLAKQVLGELIHDLKDPRIGFATVTAVRISPDLQHGRVFVSVLGSEEEQAETMKGLKSAAPFLRGELGRQMRMKYLPELNFELDTGAAEAERLESLLHRIEQEHPSAAEDDVSADYPHDGQTPDGEET
ncbi:MAG: 30S ribosome-binding factor RbfA [Actinomycetota bacterium]|nr:30S ribosome-binding factor RbfA [Actinomycetota bacterium]